MLDIEITSVVSVVSQHIHATCEENFKAMNRILGYLKTILVKGLFFGKKVEKKIEVFTDANWVRPIEIRGQPRDIAHLLREIW